MSLSTRILLGLSLGLVAGILYSLDKGQTLASLPAIIEPLGTMWVNAIRMTVVPLIAALLVTSIAGEHKSGLVAKLGGKTIGLFVVMIGGVCVYTVILAPPLLSFLSIDPAMAAALLESTDSVRVAAAELPPFRDWLVGLIPFNPFRAAVDGAMLPLVIFTVLFSVALLQIEGENKDTILRFFTAIKDAMFVLIGWIMLIAPIGIFALVFPLAARMGLSAVTILGSFVVIACSLIALMMLLLYPLAVVVGRVPLGAFARAVAPVQVIGFSTRSSLASLPATFAATEALRISARVSGLVLPVAVSLFKFSSPIARTAGTYFIARLYGIELGPTELVIIALAIGLFSFYSPGIPSGGLLIMAPVYISLGLPVEGIGILIAIDLIVDMFITATNVTANVTAAAILTRADRRK
jgi:Na+/H+-dicarboxylate symporter